MSIWQLMGLIFVAGGIGGLINSAFTDKGLVLPHTVTKGDGTSIFLPGFIGNTFLGALAAVLSWALYGPISTASSIINVANNVGTVIAALAGAVLVGLSGSGWVANAIEKHVLRAAAVQAAVAPASPDVAQQMANASPLDVYRLANSISGGVTVPASESTPVASPLPPPVLSRPAVPPTPHDAPPITPVPPTSSVPPPHPPEGERD